MTSSSPLIPPPVPELAVLAALLAVLDVVYFAMLEAHPELADDERPYWIFTPPVVPRAASVLRSVASLRRAVERYRLALVPPAIAHTPPADDNDIPF
jgi:hypothetical protein